MKWLPKIRSESGMTLIELLIAIALSGIVLAGVTRILVTSSSSYSLQEEMAAMQQNVRMAKMFIERDSRMAGCGLRDFYNIGTRVYPVEFTNNVCTPDSSKANQIFCTDTLVINYVDLDNGTCDNVLPQLTLNGKMPAASAEAVVNEDLKDDSSPPNPPYTAWTNAFVCAGITYGANTPFISFKAIITAPDGSKSDVVYITEVQANSSKLQNRPYTGFDNKIINEYPPGSTINFFSDQALSRITYSYSNGTLLRNGQVIADNLEDLQFAFGLDTNNDGIVDKWIADGASGDNVLEDAEKEQVRLIRINVLGRTSSQHHVQSNTRPAIEDHAVGMPDKHGRELIQITVSPRNLRS
jgi:type IV pilus assembly protein PilW